MINAELNGFKFTIPQEWNEVSLSQATDLYKCASKLPDHFKQVYNLRYEEQTEEVTNQIAKLNSKLTDDETISTIPKVYGEFIQILTGLSYDQVNTINRGSRVEIYDLYIDKFVRGVLVYPDTYQHTEITHFTHDKEDYYLPLIGEGFGVSVPGIDMVADDFAAASDLEVLSKQLSGGRWESAPLIIATLCRKKIKGKREKFDKMVALSRANKFKDLPMNIVFEVFFCSVQLCDTYKTISQTLEEVASPVD